MFIICLYIFVNMLIFDGFTRNLKMTNLHVAGATVTKTVGIGVELNSGFFFLLFFILTIADFRILNAVMFD